PAAGGLFGGNTQSSTGLFGQNNANNNTAGSMFGQKSTTQPGFGQAPAATAPITLGTKYSELPPDIQSQLDSIEKFINSQSGVSTSISNLTLEKDLEEIVKETEETARKLSGLKTILQRDVYVIDQLKSLVAKELRNTDLVARFIESSPTNDFNKGIQTNDAYSNYFLNFTSDLEMRMNQCRQNIEELELNLRSSHAPKINATIIQEIIKNQYQSFMSIAGKVAQVHDSITKAKDIYVQFHEKYYGNIAPENNRESYSQLAQYLQPTVQQPAPQQLNQSQFGQSQFGAQSLFGAKPIETKPAFTLSTKPASTTAAPTLNTSLFGNSLGGVGMKRKAHLCGCIAGDPCIDLLALTNPSPSVYKYRLDLIYIIMKFALFFSIALTFAAPVPKPDIEEMLLAHTNPLEFANVHTIGLLDMDLLLAAHTPNSPNPPNSMASELNKDFGKFMNGVSAIAGAVSGGTPGSGSSDCTSGSCCDSASCSMQKRAVKLQDLFSGPPKNGQLNAAGLAAANRAKNMLQDMVKEHPNNQKLKDGLTQMNSFLAKQKH
ncbi:Nucleoporin p58/p45, partial [Boothiomyces sp. JEL0866]